MDVEINEVQSTVRAIDGNSLVSPQAMDKIMRAVMAAIGDKDAHRERVRAEQRITRGVSHEQAERP